MFSFLIFLASALSFLAGFITHRFLARNIKENSQAKADITEQIKDYENFLNYDGETQQ